MNDLNKQIVPQASICRFKYNAPFAYSMTYDEGTVDALANAYPVHEKFGFPGHLDVVAGQLGMPRNCYLSSLNGRMHMSADELRYLAEKGWGIGNHSWSHFVYPTSPGLNLYREVVWSKYHLEDALQMPVRIFTICNDMNNYDPVIDLVREHYIACAAVDGGANRDGFDLYKISNFMVASGKSYPRPTFPGWPDELRTDNLTLSYLEGAWLYETTHLVMWNVPQDHKCITPADLTRRFEKIAEISVNCVWAAKPDDVIDYELMKRNLKINKAYTESRYFIFEVSGKWPVGVINSYVTIEVSGISETIGKDDIIHEIRDGEHRNIFQLCRGLEGIVQKGDTLYITMQLTPLSTVKIPMRKGD